MPAWLRMPEPRDCSLGCRAFGGRAVNSRRAFSGRAPHAVAPNPRLHSPPPHPRKAENDCNGKHVYKHQGTGTRARAVTCASYKLWGFWWPQLSLSFASP